MGDGVEDGVSLSRAVVGAKTVQKKAQIWMFSRKEPAEPWCILTDLQECPHRSWAPSSVLGSLRADSTDLKVKDFATTASLSTSFCLAS